MVLSPRPTLNIISAPERVVEGSLLDEILQHSLVQESEGLRLGYGRHVVQAEAEAEVLELSRGIKKPLVPEEDNNQRLKVREIDKSEVLNR